MESLDLARTLTNGARAALTRAAVALLVQLYGLFDRVDVVDRWYAVDGDVATVDWYRLADDVDSGQPVPVSPGERAVLLVAASLAVGYRVDLASALPAMDSTHAAGLIAAVHAAATGRDPMGTGYERFAGQDDRDADGPTVPAQLPRSGRTCAYPGDADHDHDMCIDAVLDHLGGGR